MSLEDVIEMHVEDPISRLQNQISDMGNVIRALQQKAEKNHQERHEHKRLADPVEHTSRLQSVKPDTSSGALNRLAEKHSRPQVPF